MTAPAQKKRRITRRRFLKTLLYGGLGVAGVGVWQKGEADRLTLERLTLHLPRWDAEGFKIAQISDLHLASRHAVERAVQAVRLAMAERPDVLVVTGDWIHGENPKVVDRIRAFTRATDGVPMVGVLGNHDYWNDFVPETIQALEETGRIQILRNESVEVDGVILHGIDDGIAGRDEHDRLGPGADRNAVALFHEPDFVSRIDKRFALMLAGHSHGGQMCLPGGWHLHTPRGARKYVRGFHYDAEVPLYVNRGVGTIGVPYRSFCSPEISVLTLVRG